MEVIAKRPMHEIFIAIPLYGLVADHHTRLRMVLQRIKAILVLHLEVECGLYISSFPIGGRSDRLIEKARQAPVFEARSGGCCDRCFHCNLLAYKWVGVPASYCFVAKVG